jgi:acyl carrier protein
LSLGVIRSFWHPVSDDSSCVSNHSAKKCYYASSSRQPIAVLDRYESEFSQKPTENTADHSGQTIQITKTMTKHRYLPNVERPIEDQIRYTISWNLQVEPHRLFPYTHFVDDLHLDPLDMTLLVAALESQLGVFLNAEEVASIQTIADVNRLFRQHLSWAA